MEKLIIRYKKYLSTFPFITDDDCKLFENHLVYRKLKKNELFLQKNKICNEMGFITKGLFRQFFIHNDKEINVSFFNEEQFVVDYDSFINKKQSKYFIESIEESEIISFNYETLINGYNNSKNWERFGRLISEMCYNIINERMEDFQFLNGEQRYIKLTKENPKLIERVPLYHLSSYIGMERESLSRLRKKIRDKNIL